MGKEKQMRYLITGGTGLVGSKLIPELVAEGNEVVNLSRSGMPSGMKGWENVKWDGKSVPGSVKGIDVVVNLAGANVGSRWSESYKKTILQSRIDSTQACVNFIKAQENKPQLFLSASGTNYYGDDYDTVKTEADGPGEGFLSEVCQTWEASAEGAGIRTITMRIAPVLSLDGGPLEKMATPFKMFVGGPTGSGDQGFPWIHIDDLVAAMHFFIAESSLEGPFNLSAPPQNTNREFASAIGRALNRPSFFRLPKFMLKTIFGEMSVVLWGGGKVKPAKLLEAGYQFKFPNLDAAMGNIFSD